MNSASLRPCKIHPAFFETGIGGRRLQTKNYKNLRLQERENMKLSNKAQTSINKVIEKFQTGDLSPISKVARIRLDPSAPARKWSLSNKVLAFIQTEELDCRAFGQWKDVGRYIKRGSTAAYIVRPLTMKTVKEEDGEKKENVICIGFSTIPVFPASDTEGDGALQKYQPIEFPPLYNVAKKFHILIKYLPIAPDRLGDTRPDGSKIRLGSQDPCVFFHELAHAIHAKIDGGLKGGQQVDQETIAEFTSAVLMDLYGLKDNTGNAWRYIKHYSEDPLLAITRAMGTIEKVLQVLLE